MKKSVIFLGITALTAVSSAGSVVGVAETVQNADSTATIKAVAGTKPVTPVDPEKPSEPGTNGPGEGNETGQGGSLQINYVSHLVFGEDIAITEKSITTSVKNTNTPYFQVSDLRGTGEGWSLKVSLGNFKSVDSDKVIKGATVAFNNGAVATSNETNEDAPATKAIKLVAGDNASQPMMTATAGTGKGTWLAKYTNTSGVAENDKIIFNAPTNNISANTQYVSALTWQLTDSPEP